MASSSTSGTAAAGGSLPVADAGARVAVERWAIRGVTLLWLLGVILPILSLVVISFLQGRGLGFSLHAVAPGLSRRARRLPPRDHAQDAPHRRGGHDHRVPARLSLRAVAGQGPARRLDEIDHPRPPGGAVLPQPRGAHHRVALDPRPRGADQHRPRRVGHHRRAGGLAPVLAVLDPSRPDRPVLPLDGVAAVHLDLADRRRVDQGEPRSRRQRLADAPLRRAAARRPGHRRRLPLHRHPDARRQRRLDAARRRQCRPARGGLR